MKTVDYILTHPGGAHKDDFLACCLLIHHFDATVVRREPTEAELDNPKVIVVDVGHEHDADRGNFDHHQFPADHPPTCALSLVLQYLELYEDAKSFCDWLEPAEWLDTRGPVEACKWMGISRDALSQLNSPIDITLLRRFAQHSELTSDSPIWQVMRMIGEDLVTFLKELRQRLAYVEQHAEFWQFEGANGELHEAVFMPRTSPMPDEASSGLGRFIEAQNKTESVVAMIYPDRRGEGYGLSRYNDDQRINFAGLEEDCDDVHFAHKRGFICKTSATDHDRLRELLQASVVD